MSLTVTEVRQLLQISKQALAETVQAIFKDVFEIDFEVAEILKEFSKPKPEHGDVSIACFSFLRKLKPHNDAIKSKLGVDVNPNMIANTLSKEISERCASVAGLSVNGKSGIKSVTVAGAYINVGFTMEFLGQALWSIVAGEFHARGPTENKDKVMIEYSQPNTHKAFHVGHMRNAALGDCLVRLNEQAGHEVVAVNYFGDEGAHVAKCLWYLRTVYLPKAQEAYAAGKTFDAADPKSVYPLKDISDIDSIPSSARAEWLGDLYTKAVDLLDLSNYTDLPYPVVISARVDKKEPHPNPEAPANWNVVTLTIGKDADGNDKTATVVCGGLGYNVGDYVAYLPVGAKLTKKMGVVEPRDMKGISSEGVMLAERELGGDDDEEPAPEADKEQKKAKGGKKGASAQAAATANNQIKLLPNATAPGVCLPEIGRKADFTGESVMAEFNRLKKDAADVLIALEHNDKEMVALWRKTGQWSLDEFHAIYKWLDCRFDHDFTESEVSEPSRLLVEKWFAEGKLTKHNGAVVCDLSDHNLGRCILLKSDGAGLYATKDLSLATRKFDQFNVDKSIYVVDAAQTYHFQQVFKVLELCGYAEKAKKCLHLPYGIVVLPSGRMSSRKGNVLLFSQLRSTLEKVLRENLSHGEPMSDEAVRCIAVAAIKYGMLNHDTQRGIVFEIEKWTNTTGNTGPYILYAFSRIQSIFTIRENYEGNKFDLANALKSLGVTEAEYLPFVGEDKIFDLAEFYKTPAGQKLAAAADLDKYLDKSSERLIMLQFLKLWDVLDNAVAIQNPSTVCEYVFQLAQLFSNWYEQVRLTQLDNAALPSKLYLLHSVAQLIKRVMYVLGITVVNKM